MKKKFVTFLKRHPKLLRVIWNIMRFFIRCFAWAIPVNNKRMIFSSFGGRKFDDSPKALYDYILNDSYFSDWDLIWCFESPGDFLLPRGRKVKIDTLSFYFALLSSRVWIDNSGIDRGIGIKRRKIIHVQTWHGAPLKKIGGEENSGSLASKKKKKKLDLKTIRCAQSEYDRTIFLRIFNCAENRLFLSDLPRNDYLARYHEQSEVEHIKEKLGISTEKKIILYMPTYREYLVDSHYDTFIKPPIDLIKWREKLSHNYILLVRAHYAVTKSLGLVDDDFVKDVSSYPNLNELYLIADEMISDYSSSFFDYSILGRPMHCFAYDLEEYSEKRGLYVDLAETLPCPIDENEADLLNHILKGDKESAAEKCRLFHEKFTPYAGNASRVVVGEIVKSLQGGNME